MNKTLYLAFLLLISMYVSAANTIYGKDASKITCTDIKSLSSDQLEMLATGIVIGATAEGVTVSIFSRAGLENEDDQAYIKGVSYSAFSSISPELVAQKTRETCRTSTNSNKQLVEMLVENIQASLMSGY